MPRRLYTYIYKLSLLFTTATVLTACTDDNGEPRQHQVTLMLGRHTFTPTRALPEGFVPYSELFPQVAPIHAHIQGFIVPQVSSDYISGDFAYQLNTSDDTYQWTSRLPIEEGTYYVYGFMPKGDAQSASIVARNGNFSNGAVLTINNLQAVTASDPCVVVGVKSAADRSTTLATSGIQLGEFSFTTTDENTNDYLFLLIDHLYAGLHFKMKVDPTYNELRTIKLKKLLLTASNGSQTVNTVNVSVTLASTSGGQNPLSTQAGGSVSIVSSQISSSGTPVTIWDCADENDEALTLTPTAHSFLGCFAPATNRCYILESHYDVYDRKGNLIRANQTAQNVITIPSTMERGQTFTCTINVSPTYLYMLSEPDLDTPTFTMTQ